MSEGFCDLVVWQRGIELTEAIYLLTAKFPSDERFGLTSQMRRAAVSIPSNIAERWARKSNGEYKNFLGIARGSNAELKTQLIIAARLNYGSAAERQAAEGLSLEVTRMLASLMRTL